MASAPVVFVDLNSANVSSVTWPLGSVTMIYADNFYQLGQGQGFLTTDTTQDVLDSLTANQFFSKSGPYLLPYSQAWQTVLDSVSQTFSVQPVSLTTQLGALSQFNARSQLFVSTAPPDNAFQTKESWGQFFVNVLNGPTIKEGGYPSYTCPCQNADGSSWCSLGAWNFLAQQIDLTLTNKVSTFMAPCMNPGNTMFVSEGVGNLFNVTAQIKRIRNLDRVGFKLVTATPKPCNNSVLFQLAAVTCGENEVDVCPSQVPNQVNSCTNPINTRLGLDFSIQATILGTNVLDSSRLCDNLDPIGAGIHCPLEGTQCLEVWLPLMLVNVQLEVPVTPADPFADLYCQVFDPSTAAYFGDFLRSSFSMGLAMSEKPVIVYPTVSGVPVIPDEYKTFIETAVMEAGNTVLRENLSEQLTNAFAPFFQQTLFLDKLLDVVPVCLNFSQTTLEMACPSQGFVIPPPVCDPCDFCCICYTGGDCGEKCLQRCPCVNNFCQSVDRIIYPIWWKLVAYFLIAVAVILLIAGAYVRGIQQ